AAKLRAIRRPWPSAPARARRIRPVPPGVARICARPPDALETATPPNRQGSFVTPSPAAGLDPQETTVTDDIKPWFPIRTERLLLRAFTQADFDAVHAYATDDAVVRFMDWGPNTPEETQAFLDRSFAAQARWPRPDVNLAIHH